jgi:hypothetical protein
MSAVDLTGQYEPIGRAGGGERGRAKKDGFSTPFLSNKARKGNGPRQS